MFCVSPVSPLLFSRAYRFFSRVAAESAVWGICRFLRRGCVFRRGWCFCLCWYNWKVETPSVMLLGRLPCVSGCLDAKRPPVVSDGIYFCYWFCWYDCFWLFLRFRRGFVGKDEVPSPSLPYPPLVLPSALLFVLQQPAYAVQDFAHFVFVVALANILYECFGVYPVFHVFPSGFKLAHHYQQTTGQSIDLIIQCGDMGAFQDNGILTPSGNAMQISPPSVIQMF